MPPKRKAATKAAENLKGDDAKDTATEAGTKRKAKEIVDDNDDEQGSEDDASQNSASSSASRNKEDDSAQGDETTNADSNNDAAAPAPKKRKTSTTKTTSSPSHKLLTYLLSDAAMSLAYPPASPASPNSTSNKSKSSSKITYPHSALTPFQALLAALILSKPLSHRLGQRSINTLLNAPYDLTGPDELAEAGFEGRREALDAARTQHRQKTADELGDLVEVVRNAGLGGEGEGKGQDGEQGLVGLRGMIGGLGVEEAQGRVREVLVDKVKGLGPTGVGIFLRRVQGEWAEVYPFVDERSLGAAREMGLLEDGEGAEELVEKIGQVSGAEVEEDEKRRKLDRLLDVLVGLALEKKLDEAKKAAESAGAGT
jgi:hypothetical protein